jgi:hypothetical protein
MLAFASGPHCPGLKCFQEQTNIGTVANQHFEIWSLQEQPTYLKNFDRRHHNRRPKFSPLFSDNNFTKKEKFQPPPFKVNDKSALLAEIGLIIVSQLLVGLYKSTTSPVFSGWLAPVNLETFLSPTFQHTIIVTSGLSFFWVLSRWWSRSLETDVYFFRLKDAFDATWQQWIAVANLYIGSSLVYSFINHEVVTGIEVPLLSGAAAILVARILYYGIPI